MAQVIQRGGARAGGGGGLAETIQAAIMERRKQKADAAGIEAIIGMLDPTSNRGKAAAGARGKKLAPNQLLQLLNMIQEKPPEEIDDVDFFGGDGRKVTVPVPQSVRMQGGQALDQYGREKIGVSEFSFTPPPVKVEAKNKTIDVYNETEGRSAKVDLPEELVAKGPIEIEMELVRRNMPGYSPVKKDETKTVKGYRYLEDGTVEERDIGVPAWATDPDQIEEVAKGRGFTTVKRTPPDEAPETEKMRDIGTQLLVWGLDPTPENANRARHYVNYHDDAKRQVNTMFGAILEGDMLRPPADPFNNFVWSIANRVIDSREGPLAQMKTVSEAAETARDQAYAMLKAGVGFPAEAFDQNKIIHFIPAVNYLRRSAGFQKEDIEQYLELVGLNDVFLAGQGLMFDKQGNKINNLSVLASTLIDHGGVFNSRGDKETF